MESKERTTEGREKERQRSQDQQWDRENSLPMKTGISQRAPSPKKVQFAGQFTLQIRSEIPLCLNGVFNTPETGNNPP